MTINSCCDNLDALSTEQINQADLSRLSNIIRNFARTLTPIDRLDSSNYSFDERRVLVIVHCLIRAAIIELHRAYPDTNEATTVSLYHAGEIIRAIEYLASQMAGQNPMAADPILGVSSYFV